ncbi:V-type ATP synthase subunit E [Deinococcus sonorensis]|uniref:V-type ATP synthase subunit E n=2 Tax=Deinococcus sonorensis TaxID=309891 RepID=A0AAU7UCB3_9DEIO
MSLADILESEIQGEIARIQGEARERAEAIRAQARERAEALVESRQRALEMERVSGLTRARSAADLDSNAQRLSAADTLQSRAFQEAEAQLRSIPQHPEYAQILARLIQEAHAALPTAEAIETTPAEMGAVQQALGQLGLPLQVRENPAVVTGVRLVGAGGKTSVQNTLLGRLQAGQGTLSAQVSRLLNEQA